MTEDVRAEGEAREQLDATLRGAKTPLAEVAKRFGVPLDLVHARMRGLMWLEIRHLRQESVLTDEEAAALGLCWPALEAEARRRGVLPQAQAAYAKIEALLQGLEEYPGAVVTWPAETTEAV